MGLRKPISTEFGKRMSKTGNSRMSMNGNTSKGFSNWVNKDIREAEQSGDWTALLQKSEKQIRAFRRHFYA